MPKSLCTRCNETFKSVAGFDKHRTGKFEIKRRCLTPEEMLAIGMSQNDKGWWITSVYEASAHIEDEE